MPAEFIVAFMAGQAIGLAAGVTVGTAAQRCPATAHGRARSIAAPRNALARAYPASRTRSCSALRWSARKLADVVIEVEAARAARYADALTLAGVLASLPKANVLSDVPGRVHLRVKSLKGREQRAQTVAAVLKTGEGIREVTASAWTSSIVIHYDRKRFGTLNALMEWIATERV